MITALVLCWLAFWVLAGGSFVWRACDLILDRGRYVLGTFALIAAGVCGCFALVAAVML